MDIVRPAIAGTLESSDCQVTVEKGEGNVDFSMESSVINQYGNQIRKVALETLKKSWRQRRKTYHRRQRCIGLYDQSTY